MTKLDSPHGPIAWMAKNKVASNLAMIILLLGGLIVSKQIKQEVFPEFSLDMVIVSVPYPGASPEEIEKGIILPIEEAIQSVDGVKEVISSAVEGVGTVRVEMIDGEDVQKFSKEIQNEIDRIRSFPEDAEDHKVTIASRKREVISLILFGDQDIRHLYELAEQLRDTLTQDPGITLVELSGVPSKEISIEVSEKLLRTYNISLAEIANKVAQSSVELPSGSIKTTQGEVLVRVSDRKDYGKDFSAIPVLLNHDGTPLRLGDIASIHDGFQEQDFQTMYEGKPGIIIEIFRVGRQTPIEIADIAQKYLANFKSSLPQGVEISLLNDRSKIYRQRVELLIRNGLFGWILVIILLSIFLEIKLAFWVAMGVPISFLGSFLFIPQFDISINMVSLFAFIISLGIVVDDAIVVGENIFSHRQKGLPFSKAVIVGAREVAMPVTFSVLTNIAAFLPLYFVPGIMGKIFKNIPVVVISVFAISLIECIFILPSHLNHEKKKTKAKGLFGWLYSRQQAFSIGFKRNVKRTYGPILKKILYFRYSFVALGIAILIISVSFAKSGRLGMTTFMKIESDYAKATIRFPYGTPLSETKKWVSYMVEQARKVSQENGGDKLVQGISSSIGLGWGMSGSHNADIRVFLTEPDIRPLSTDEFTQKWRKEVGQIPGAERVLFESDAGGPGSGSALSIELSHRNVEILNQASLELAETLNQYPLAKDIDSGVSEGKEQVDYKINEKGEVLGLTSESIARQLRNAYYGHEVTRQLRGRNEVKIIVRYPLKERISEYHLEQFLVKTPKGKEVPLSEVAYRVRGRAFTSIDRKDGRRIRTVSCDVTPRSKAGQIKGNLEEEKLKNLQAKYPGLTYSFSGKQADMQESIQALGFGMIFAVLVIYAMLAIPFKSYIQPLIIMVSIPFGVIGAVLGHLIMGFPLSILSMFGVVALSGVVVNDSLVLIELANRKFNEGMPIEQSILYSAVHRFRPILLTTLTTFGGLAPMIFETSRQAKFLVPMAISLGYGILFATFITLVLVPCFYLMIEDLKNFFSLLLGTKKRSEL